MPRPRKFEEIARILEQRISTGSYAINGLPGERKIAAEFGVSHMTARKAVQYLIQSDLLPRRPVGRIAEQQARVRPCAELNIAFVCPAYESLTYMFWYKALKQAMQDERGNVRIVGYVGWHDPAILEALDGEFDGIFFVPPSEMSDLLLARLAQERHRVVTLFLDYTELGVPCIDFGSPRFICNLAEHLRSLGHGRVDCFNAQPHDCLITQRINAWRQGAQDAGIRTQLRDFVATPFEDAAWRAYRAAREFLAEPGFDATGIFCANIGTAVGLMRAAYELGIRVGRDLSVCACDAHEQCRLMTPSLTTLVNPDRVPLMRAGLEWLKTGGHGWSASLKIEPADVAVWPGESTCRAPVASVAAATGKRVPGA